MINAIVLIDADVAATAELGPALAGLDGVVEVFSVAGSDADLVAIVKVVDHEAVATVVTERIAQTAGVRDTRTMIAFRQYSAADLDAAFEGFAE